MQNKIVPLEPYADTALVGSSHNEGFSEYTLSVNPMIEEPSIIEQICNIYSSHQDLMVGGIFIVFILGIMVGKKLSNGRS